MTLTKRQKAVLIGAIKDLDYYASLTPRYEHGNWGLIRQRERIECARENIVATDPAKWLGEPMNPSLATMVSRCYAQLQDKGLVMRQARAWSDRYTTHLRLTPEGERVARELLSVEEPNYARCVASPSGPIADDPKKKAHADFKGTADG